MSNLFSIIIQQIMIMFILIIVGYILYKVKFINLEGITLLSNLVIYITNPANMFVAFASVSISENINIYLAVLIFSLLYFVLCSILIPILFKNKDGIIQSSMIFANSGFVGIPLVSGILGSEYIPYLTIYCAIQTIFIWTVQIYLVSKDRSTISFKKILTNPCIIIVAISFISSLLNIKYPTVIIDSFSVLKNMNTGLIMLLLGAYIAQCDILKVIKNKDCYFATILRNLVIPLSSLLLLILFKDLNLNIKLTLLIACSCPCITMTAIFSSIFKKNTELASGIIAVSTIFSLISLPLILMLATKFY